LKYAAEESGLGDVIENAFGDSMKAGSVMLEKEEIKAAD
jgi:hypothetical protein